MIQRSFNLEQHHHHVGISSDECQAAAGRGKRASISKLNKNYFIQQINS